jgi:hypothetical protein
MNATLAARKTRKKPHMYPADQLRLRVLKREQPEDEVEAPVVEQAQVGRFVVMKAHAFAVRFSSRGRCLSSTPRRRRRRT